MWFVAYWQSSCNDGITFRFSEKKFKNLFLKEMDNTCVVHRCALPSRTSPTLLKNGLDSTIKIIDYIKSGSLHSCLFKELYKDMKLAHEALLLHTSVRCTLAIEKKRSNRVFEMKDEIKLFQELEANEFTSYVETLTRFGWKVLLIWQKFLKIEWLKSKVSRKGYKHHPASRRICKHFIRSCKTVVGT